MPFLSAGGASNEAFSILRKKTDISGDRNDNQ